MNADAAGDADDTAGKGAVAGAENGSVLKAVSDAEAKLDAGNVQEAECSLREGLSLNFEEARALLGRLQYQRGNVEAALHVFDGIDLQATIQRFQPLALVTKGSHPSAATGSGSEHAAASLLLEAIYLKTMSLVKLGKAAEAAQECKSVVDSVERMFQNGSVPDTALQGTVSKAVEVLPELWKQAGCHQEALDSYRRALLGQWNLDDECSSRIQKRFAAYLLFGGVEASPPNLAAPIEGTFIPKNNLEEAILLLMIVLRKCNMGKIKWDPSVLEYLMFALSLCSQSNVLARHLEEVLPCVYPRTERWHTLALCYSSARQNDVALNLLRMSLNKHESPNDIPTLLLAAKLCAEESSLASEGIEYARRAISNSEVSDKHLKSAGLHFLGRCLGKKSRVAASNNERAVFQSEALKSLIEAISLYRHNQDLVFDLGLEYSEQRNMNGALRCAKEFIDATGGSVFKGWRLLALVLSAQKKYSEAEAAIDAALDETAKWQHGPLLRMKAKIKVAQSLPSDAVEVYRYLLALIQAQKKSSESSTSYTMEDDDSNKVSECEVWLGLASLYSSLSYWEQAEICLQKAREIIPY